MSQDESKGLPMTAKWDPDKLQKEIESLNELDRSPFFTKVGGYIKRSGPGLLQSAMTLGAGSAAASVVAGASFGYKLLWVQPLAMFLGVCMLAALSKVVLTKQEKPYQAFRRELGAFGPLLVFLWALGTISASVIWHFPQYGLASGAVKDLVMTATGQTALQDGAANCISWCTGLAILFINIVTVWSYGGSRLGIKIYENFLRLVIFLVILSFGIVVVYNFGKIDWLAMGRGFCGLDSVEILKDPKNLILVLGMLGAAVGINMTFLYPYSLLAKGWGPHHRTLAKWDLGMSMFIPFVLVTSLIMVGMTVGGVYTGDVLRDGLKPLEASEALVKIIGPAGRIIFDLGLIGMTCGAISAHMVVCGFTLPEMCGFKYTKWTFRICAMLPSIGMLGVMIKLPFWFPVFASAICFTMLPVAYLIFLIMSNKKSYLGDEVGKGPLHAIFNLILVVALVISIIGAAIAVKDRVIGTIKKNVAKPAVTAPAETADATPAENADATPAENADATPAENADAAPAENADAAPAENADAAPAENADAAPAENADAAPAENADAAPAENADATPAENADATPAKNADAAPAENAEAAPAENADAAPAENADAAPAENADAAPAENADAAPAENADAAPAENADAAPAENADAAPAENADAAPADAAPAE